MQLPTSLRRAIEDAAQGIKPTELARASSELSGRYRAGQEFAGNFPKDESQRIAYLITRMPATYAVLRSVFSELVGIIPEVEIRSLLDLGAGPGSSLWAAKETFGGLRKATLCDRDPDLIRLGKKLVAHAEDETGLNAEWEIIDLRGAKFTPHQLVVCSYSLGELGAKSALEVARSAWEVAEVAVVFVEPGTLRGFGLIRQLRAALISWGANLLAPCPHDEACPMGADDWCHFAARVERTSLHRYLKTGERGHEDEKYSYLIATKHPFLPAAARIIRHPRRHSGFAQLMICAADGIENLTVTRSQKELWRKVRKIEWGDAWDG